MSTPTIAYELLMARARQAQATGDGRTRVVVQDAHCSRAVGSGAVVEALHQALAGRSDVALTIAGCDGACWLAPRVLVITQDGQQAAFSHVRAADVPGIVASVAAPLPSAADAGGFWSLQRRVVLRDCGVGDTLSLDSYVARGGYGGLAKALAMPSQEVIAEVLHADLRGRGGAYFPAARKWQAARAAQMARAASKPPLYLVVNAEEGEPGVFKDRHVMEGDPHRLLEGMLIAAYASGASKAFIYINAEANLSAERVEIAVAQARERGVIGDGILGSTFACAVEVRRGAGGYVCGEETTLLSTVEGYRRVPRLRPPFPTDAGLWGKPTVINNVETLANLSFILAEGAEAYRMIGQGAPGTKLISLGGAVRRPGLVEVPLGMTLRQIIYDIGGGPKPGHRIVAVAAGGPSGGLLPDAALDVAIAPGLLHPTGAVLGSGGMTVVDDTMPVPQVVRLLAQYNARESCGKCTPCREGTPRMAQALERLAEGKGSAGDIEELRALAEIVPAASLCGLGQMAAGPITSALHFFGDEFSRLAR